MGRRMVWGGGWYEEEDSMRKMVWGGGWYGEEDSMGKMVWGGEVNRKECGMKGWRRTGSGNSKYKTIL